MRRIIVLLLSIVFMAGIASAEETKTDFLGKPFPDFTVTDTEGSSFTLSEALKDHEAVLINFWATWCDPCNREFPFLNEVYEKYRDRVAFIALSTDLSVTLEEIAEYRKTNNLSIPMGRDEGMELGLYLELSVIPDTLIVDRFGNAAFFHQSILPGKRELELVLDAFLGDGYTETAVLSEIPKDTSNKEAESETEATQAYVLHVVDQDNNPVEEVAVNFCTDNSCFPMESDESGTITFSKEPDVYHVTITDVPEGYSWDEEFEMYTTREYGEWVLRVRKE